MDIRKIIIKKRKNNKLTKEEITFVVNEFTNGNINEKDMSEFLLLIKQKSLTFKETFYLTDAMIKTGEVIDLSSVNKIVVDKHSTGGVGDKVTLIVAPIVASLHLAVAKMSGRSLGFTGGTIDKLESIEGYETNLSNEEFIKNVNEIGISVISQTKTVAVADKKIYALRDEIGAVDSIPLIASSIMSKKIASGADNIVIDLKVGSGAFMKDLKSAKKLSKTMIKIAKYYNKKVVCVLTDMNFPIGNSIGNSLEVKEVIDFFDGFCDERLERLTKYIASCMVSISKNISFKKAYSLVEETLYNGLAKQKFYEWINIQHGNIHNLKGSNCKTIEIKSNKSGYITNIDSLALAKFCHRLGAGRTNKEDIIDYGVGVVLNVKPYEKVNEESTLLTVYYNKFENFDEEELRQIFKIESIIPKESDIIISVIK